MDLGTDKATEKKEIETALAQAEASALIIGDSYYLISVEWWASWKRFVGYDSIYFSSDYPPPGPINNSSLVDEDGELKKSACEDSHFVYLPKTAWDYLYEIYKGGPALPRLCVERHGSATIDLRKLKLFIIWSRRPKEQVARFFGKYSTLKDLLTEMRKEMKWNSKNIRVYDFFGSRKTCVYDPKNHHRCLADLQILDGQQIIIEERKRNGAWPNDSIYDHFKVNTYFHQSSPSPPGQTGLTNLGNTCFMNSALQCLSATAPLTDFFLEGNYKKDINESNPLGMKGEMAEEYKRLLTQLWSPLIGEYAPRNMKEKIENFAPQFSGYSQHDSQELLAFFLDGLHEDLNRVTQKPFVEALDTWTADDAWKGHKERNDSVIVDMFQGQLKSLLRCPKNSRTSTVYDPFMYLTVPLPSENTRKLFVTLYRLDLLLPPLKVGVDVPKLGTVKDLKSSIRTHLHPSGDQSSIIVVEIYYQKIFKEWEDHEALANISDADELAAYQIEHCTPKLIKQNIFDVLEEDIDLDHPPDLNSPPQETVDAKTVHIVITCEKKSDSYYSPMAKFGAPFLLEVPASLTYVELYLLILKRLSGNAPEGATSGGIFKRIPPTNISAEPTPNGFTPDKGCFADNTIFEIDAKKNNGSLISLKQRQAVKLLWKNSQYDEFVDDKITHIELEVHPSGKLSSLIQSAPRKTLSLTNCLRLFNEEEQLVETDAWYCPECKEHVRAFKKFSIWRAPKILVIHLKRFAYYGQTTRERLDHVVDFPLKDFDITEFVEGPQEAPYKYDLYAISNHFGDLMGGHYTAFCKSRNDDTWFEFDDTKVSLVSNPQSMIGNAAYVLFYKRQDVDWPPFHSSETSQLEKEDKDGELANTDDDYDTASDEEVDHMESDTDMDIKIETD